MPVTLPLELVLGIVDVYIQRDFFDEDWAPYHHRLAPLCLVCKDFKEVVQPVLWSHLRVSTDRQLKELAAPRTGAAHLFKHVEEFLGLGPLDKMGGEDDQQPAQLVRSKFPGVKSTVLRAFGTPTIVMDAFIPFTALRALAIQNYDLPDVRLDLVLPNLESLSLTRIRADPLLIERLLWASCTPSLKHLFVAQASESSDSNYAQDYAQDIPPLDDMDLRRLTVVQFRTQQIDLVPDPLCGPNGPFDPAASVMLSWKAPTDGFFPEGELPRHLQLIVPAEVLNDSSYAFPSFAVMCRRIVFQIERGAFDAIFLPLALQRRTLVEWWIEGGIKHILEACRETSTKVVYYRDSDETRGRILDAFVRFAACPMADANPLVLEEQIEARDKARVARHDHRPAAAELGNGADEHSEGESSNGSCCRDDSEEEGDRFLSWWTHAIGLDPNVDEYEQMHGSDGSGPRMTTNVPAVLGAWRRITTTWLVSGPPRRRMITTRWTRTRRTTERTG